MEGNTARKSHLWRSLLTVLPDFKKGIAWYPKDGANVHFWRDTWLIDKPLVDYLNSIPLEHINRKVNDYVTPAGNWDWNSIERLLLHNILLHLAAFKINVNTDEKDIIIWNKSSSGKFTTKSAFAMLSPASDTSVASNLRLIWKLKIPHYFQYFTWLACQGKLLTNEERQQRHLIDYTNCGSCSLGPESIIHVLRYCSHSSGIWQSLGVLDLLPNFFSCDVYVWWQLNLKCINESVWEGSWNLIFCCVN